MIPYFPFSRSFNLGMGTAPLPPSHARIEVDRHYTREVEIKKQLLAEQPHYYFQATPESEDAQWETWQELLPEMAHHYPDYFQFAITHTDFHFENLQMGTRLSGSIADRSAWPLAPLHWLGLQLQEDLLLLDSDGILQAGLLCFPSGWSLSEKLNQNFLTIHAPLPEVMNPMLQAANKFMGNLKAGKPMHRTNWGFRVTPQLDLSTRHANAYRADLQRISAELTPENAGEKIWLRVEHQTLSRLPKTEYILFTLHTFLSRVAEEVVDPQRADDLFRFLTGVPPDLLHYKQMETFCSPLLQYLKQKAKGA